MKATFSFILFILTFQSFAQIVFEKGYIVDHQNQKTECLIKNQDWVKNPTFIEYKTTNNKEVQKVNPLEIKEFKVYEGDKYIGVQVDIDRSSYSLTELSESRNPEFQNEALFLKVLIEGEANLYKYSSRGIVKYFYKVKDGDVKQLVYKEYLHYTKENTRKKSLLENNYFRQQLMLDLKCNTIKESEFTYLKYNEKALSKMIYRYNKAMDETYKIEKKETHTGTFKFNLRAGLNSSSLSYNNPIEKNSIDHPSQLNGRYGVELEYILPVKKNKWSIFLEPTYQKYATETEIQSRSVLGGKYTSKIDYASIELPVGLRYYMFATSDIKFFVNAAALFDFALDNSTIELIRENGVRMSAFDIKSRLGYAIGGGVQFKDRLSFELRYNGQRDLLKSESDITTKYQSLSFILGYSLFRYSSK
ncbi:PorT family protein [Flammeovirga sp. MY04]|uniref:porin family protein n=1 Tax=Flammeovirga sp. MY04 TaxID=1191459 RepID=UPI000806361D|nr:porin family protein [Flammeovirga sp. MY04]ANQ51885.1 PorT family protein [Flammeovirga sp. MY04]